MERRPLGRTGLQVSALGVIAKRPVANVVWRHGPEGPGNQYHRVYWDRLKRLDFDFTRAPLAEAVELALRFTLCQPGVSTAIVGTSSPGRWAENARSVAKGPLPQAVLARLRARWAERAEADWTGQQ